MVYPIKGLTDVKSTDINGGVVSHIIINNSPQSKQSMVIQLDLCLKPNCRESDDSWSPNSCNNTLSKSLLITGLIVIPRLLPAALRAAQACRYLVYSEADFEAFRPAGATRCTDWGEIWHLTGPLLHAKFRPHRCNDKGVGPQKLKFFPQI